MRQMVAADEQSGMQYKDHMNTAVSNNLTPRDRSIDNGMLNKETDSKVVDNTKSEEGLSPMPVLESSRVSDIAKWWAAKASSKQQSASGTTTKVSLLTMKSN
jgi:hypothetical protein